MYFLLYPQNLEGLIYIKPTIFSYSFSAPSHICIPRKNLAVKVYSTDNYLASDIIAQQGAKLDEIISKHSLDIDQVIQINIWVLQLKSEKLQQLLKKKEEKEYKVLELFFLF